MGIVMVAMLAFGGTFAYFTATATSKSAKLTTGTVNLKSGSEYTLENATILPGDTIIGKEISYVNTSDVAVYIFVKFTLGLDTGSALPTDGSNTSIDAFISVDKTGAATWQELALEGSTDTKIYYIKTEGKATAGTGDTYLLAKSVVCPDTLKANSHEGVAAKEMGITFSLGISARAIQAKGFADIAAGKTAVQQAYEAAFDASIKEETSAKS